MHCPMYPSSALEPREQRLILPRLRTHLRKASALRVKPTRYRRSASFQPPLRPGLIPKNARILEVMQCPPLLFVPLSGLALLQRGFVRDRFSPFGAGEYLHQFLRAVEGTRLLLLHDFHLPRDIRRIIRVPPVNADHVAVHAAPPCVGFSWLRRGCYQRFTHRLLTDWLKSEFLSWAGKNDNFQRETFREKTTSSRQEGRISDLLTLFFY